MRIRYLVLDAFVVGGTVRAVFNQAQALAEAGHEVEIVSVWRRRRKPRLPHPEGVRLHWLIDTTTACRAWRRRLDARAIRHPSTIVPAEEPRSGKFNRLTDRRVAEWLRELPDGVVIGTRPGLNLLLAQLAPDRLTVIGQEHSHYSRHQPKLAVHIGYWYRRLDALTVLNAADRAAYARVLDGSRVRIARIPNPLPAATPQPCDPGSRVLVSAGRLVKAKGFQHLIAAFARLDAPGWRLRIFGSGPYREKLERQIAESGLAERVELRGHTTDLAGELARSAVFGLASRHEGFGMVLVEAMSHGIPVVSFDCPHGPAEIISHGRDGFLVPLGDVAGLSEHLDRLIGDDAARLRMGRAAAESARRYRAADIARLWGELLDRLAADRPEWAIDPTSRKVDDMRDPKPQRRSHGELESAVLAALWAADRALTPTEIHADLDGDLAYNTVHTILKRLWDKGAVIRDADGRRGAYRPAKTAVESTAEAMHLTLDRAPNPIESLQHFAAGLDPAEERALRDWLNRKSPS